MALDADDLAAIREHVGSTPTDVELETRWDRLGTVASVALSVLRERLADMLARPADLSVDGDYRESYQANLRILREQVATLEAAVASGGSPGVVHVARLTRGGRSR